MIGASGNVTHPFLVTETSATFEDSISLEFLGIIGCILLKNLPLCFSNSCSLLSQTCNHCNFLFLSMAIKTPPWLCIHGTRFVGASFMIISTRRKQTAIDIDLGLNLTTYDNWILETIFHHHFNAANLDHITGSIFFVSMDFGVNSPILISLYPSLDNVGLGRMDPLFAQPV
jgi:hypothetical protein